MNYFTKKMILLTFNTPNETVESYGPGFTYLYPDFRFPLSLATQTEYRRAISVSVWAPKS